MMRSVSHLNGSTLHASDGEIGTVKQAYFDDESWTIRYLVVETGSWLGGRSVLISPQSVEQPLDSGQIVNVSLTREQVQNSPPIDTHQPVSRQLERATLDHYGYPAYWGGGGALWAMGAHPMVPLAPAADAQREHADPGDAVPREDERLRSTAQVTGHDIQATDGSIGHVEDFLFDDESWAIRWLIVDTRNWWPGGKKVLLAPPSIERIDWPQSKVFTRLTRDEVKSRPEYDASASVREYDARLYDASRNDGHWT